jgi:hypothetical protein
MRRSKVAGIAAGFLVLARIATPQVAISARSGMINYVEGQVLLDNQPVSLKLNAFPQLSQGSELRTEDGRAEVLLGPGVFMRLGENSAVRMVSDDIVDTRLEFLAGSVIVETADMPPDGAVTFFSNGASIGLLKKGLYRIDGEPAQISVYDGEASVIIDGQAQIVTRDRRLRLDRVAVAEKFDTKDGDALFRWAKRRSEYLAMANISAAGQAQRTGMSSSNTWIWNSYFGAYTFLPLDGFYENFWGCQFWGTGTVYTGGGSKPVTPPVKGPPRPRPPGAPIHPPSHPVKWPGHDAAASYASWTAHAAGPGHASGSAFSGSGRSGGGGFSGGGGGRSGGGGFSGGGSFGGGGRSGGSSSGGGGHSGGGGFSGGGGGGGHSGGGGFSGGGGGGGGSSAGGGGGRGH